MNVKSSHVINETSRNDSLGRKEVRMFSLILYFETRCKRDLNSWAGLLNPRNSSLSLCPVGLLWMLWKEKEFLPLPGC